MRPGPLPVPLAYCTFGGWKRFAFAGGLLEGV
jgi:hypothetical protein